MKNRVHIYKMITLHVKQSNQINFGQFYTGMFWSGKQISIFINQTNFSYFKAISHFRILLTWSVTYLCLLIWVMCFPVTISLNFSQMLQSFYIIYCTVKTQWMCVNYTLCQCQSLPRPCRWIRWRLQAIQSVQLRLSENNHNMSVGFASYFIAKFYI